VLLGSDPLPLALEETRAGSCGFVLPDWAMSARPAEALVHRLASLRSSPAFFGDFNTPYAFVRSQLQLRWQRSVAANQAARAS
jgi:hypothetical protein